MSIQVNTLVPIIDIYREMVDFVYLGGVKHRNVPAINFYFKNLVEENHSKELEHILRSQFPNGTTKEKYKSYMFKQWKSVEKMLTTALKGV